MTTTLRDEHFRRMVGHALRYKRLLVLTIVAGVISLSLTFVFPWLIGAAIDHVIAPATPEAAAPGERRHWLALLIGIGVATAITSAFVAYARGHWTVKLGNRLITDLRRDLFEHLQRLSLHFYSQERTGSIMSRLINDIQEAANFINGGAILVVMDAVQTLVAVVLLLLISWKLALACLTILPLYALTFRVFNKRVHHASRRVQQQMGKISGTVQERLSGIALVKSNAAEQRECHRFAVDTEEHYGRVVEQSNIAHIVGGISEGLIHLGTMIVIGYGGYLAAFGHPRLTAGDITRFLGYVGIMYGPVRRFADLNVIYQTSLAAIHRVFEVLDITPRIVQKPHAVMQAPPRGQIIFDHVSFRYDKFETEGAHVGLDSEEDEELDESIPKTPVAAKARSVLKDLSFNVNAGEKIALVGPSGSGKTTLVSLLPRLYDVSDGRILIDGVDSRDYGLNPLRESIAVVQQESFVFTGTIRDNLCYGRPKACEDEMIQASRAANAHDFIMALPDGYNTLLGERGVNLSGGERQRLSIARALLKNPRILILDEVTSALDAENETLVQAAMEWLMRGRTCFIIAHRLSTVRNADRILVLQDGRIVESGSHELLVAKDGLYARLVRQQFQAPAPEPRVVLQAAG